MVYVSVIMFISGLVQGDPALIDIVTDAQASSLQRVRQGQLSASIQNEFPKKGTVHASVRATWDGEDVYYLMKVSDPDEVISKDGSYKLPLPDAYESIGLIVKDNLSMYNPIANVLHIYKVKREDALGTLGFLEVIPSMNWVRCCPPWTSAGLTWSKSLLPKSPFHREGSRLDINLDPKTGLIVYTRIDPGVGTYKLTFSLDLGGNLLEHRFDSDGGDVRSTRGRLEWQKNADGSVVLTKRVYEQFAENDNSQLEFRSTLLIESLQLMKTRSPLLSQEYLKSQLPRNALVQDHATKKTYPLTTNAPPDQKLKELGTQLKAGRFFQGK